MWCNAGELKLERATAGSFIQDGGAMCRTSMLSGVALVTMQAQRWTVQRTAGAQQSKPSFLSFVEARSGRQSASSRKRADVEDNGDRILHPLKNSNPETAQFQHNSIQNAGKCEFSPCELPWSETRAGYTCQIAFENTAGLKLLRGPSVLHEAAIHKSQAARSIQQKLRAY